MIKTLIEPDTSSGPFDNQLCYGEAKAHTVGGGVVAAGEEAVEYFGVLARGYPWAFILNSDLQRRC